MSHEFRLIEKYQGLIFSKVVTFIIMMHAIANDQVQEQGVCDLTLEYVSESLGWHEWTPPINQDPKTQKVSVSVHNMTLAQYPKT